MPITHKSGIYFKLIVHTTSGKVAEDSMQKSCSKFAVNFCPRPVDFEHTFNCNNDV